MAKPAEKALARVLARHPSATVTERRESSLTCDVGAGKKALVTQIGAMHYRETEAGGEDWLPIDTAWLPAAGAWQFEMLNGPYLASARDSLSAGEVLEYAARSGEWVRFQPLALNWRDENGSTQQIATPQAVAAQVAGDEQDILSWPAGYGAGRDFEWRAHPTRLQKLLTIQAASDLPAPTVAGGGVELELTFAFTFDASVTAFVDGVAWDRSATRTTGSAIEFRDGNGETLWHFTAPRAWDSEGTETTGVMSFYRVGNVRHVAVRVPRAFVDASVFPLFVDPTVDVSIAEGADDVMVTVDGEFFNAIAHHVGFGTNSSDIQDGAFRFQMPADIGNASITTADLTGVATATYSSLGCHVRIRCEAADDAAQITSAADFTGRPLTTAYTDWSPVAFTAGAAYATPDFATAVEEVVTRSGWVTSGYVNVFIHNNGSGGAVQDFRRFAAYENTEYDPASLYVEYTEAEGAALGDATAGTAADSLPVTANLAPAASSTAADAGTLPVPATTLTPDGTITATGVQDQTAGTTNLHLAINEGWDAPDDDTTYIVNSGDANGSAWFSLTNTPADFGSMTTLRARIRAKRE